MESIVTTKHSTGDKVLPYTAHLSEAGSVWQIMEMQSQWGLGSINEAQVREGVAQMTGMREFGSLRLSSTEW